MVLTDLNRGLTNATKVSHATVNFAVEVDEALMNSREVAYIKGITGAQLTQKGTFADTYTTGTAQFGGRTRGPTRLEIGEDGEVEEVGELTIAGAVFIFANDVIGPGLVGVAYVCNNTGIIPFIVFMAISCISMIWALDILCACGVMAGIKNYESVGVLSLGRKGMYITSAAIAMECYGALIAYVVMIGNTAPVLANMVQVDLSGPVLMTIVCVGAVLPTCCLKNLNLLAFTAQYSAVVFTALMLTNVYNAFGFDWYEAEGLNIGIPDTEGVFVESGSNYPYTAIIDGVLHIQACPPTELKWIATDVLSLFRNLPTLIFAMSCVPSALPVFNEMADGKFESMKVANRISIYTSASLYVIVAICGYSMSKDNTLSNNLLNMRQCICYEYADYVCSSTCTLGSMICKDDNLWGAIMNLAFGLAIIAGYATMHYVLRRSIVTVIWGESAEFSWFIHVGVAVANVGCTLIIAIFAGDVSVVFNWAGALGVPAVGFLLPGIYFNILLGKRNKFPEDKGLSRSMANVMIGAGTAFMVGGSAMQLF